MTLWHIYIYTHIHLHYIYICITHCHVEPCREHPFRVRTQVAAMTQAAEIAREQALQLLRLQQEVARRVESLTFSDDKWQWPCGFVWKWLVPHCTQWFCWSLSLLNGYFIGGIPHFQTMAMYWCRYHFPEPIFSAKWTCMNMLKTSKTVYAFFVETAPP